MVTLKLSPKHQQITNLRTVTKKLDVQEPVRQVLVTRSNEHKRRLITYSDRAEAGDPENGTSKRFQNKKSDQKLVADEGRIQDRIFINIRSCILPSSATNF